MKQKNSSKNTYILGGSSFALPKCMLCDNFIEDHDKHTMRCKAFPRGIPSTVIWEPYEKECNNGIKFEENEYIPPVEYDWWYFYIQKAGKEEVL